ncbi:ATP-dependent Lon protease [Bathymodiolus platifrons methanotrophic gill symbiont]|uniref:BREX system Lon protease-like protein BrxL n=2 Tax=Gammaproteobacteria TaxID=1236 RepID=UPI000B41A1F6|nr:MULTISPECIES: BREX system Lon protease-like protein BrxL [unclassified Gammaproteobacteria]TXL12889.1 TIGR02688 family protein [Methylococcaceae bacterium HT4]GAW86202.1 ATP-dependent Lon protease [Bathymodiolus platifrons methanotrophic gill symbiont]GFO73031.1 ATP-dependent Lon protease [Bathymodiolus japonicus methanotrophic gill symbiont]GFO76031.1 ATP-dependent Lon protease [Bathymodiolus platifrons methanotrophic gill symbiont]
MNKEQLDYKIRETFSELIIDKALVRQLKIRDNRSIPSFVEEWMVSRFQTGNKSEAEVHKEITDFMSKHLPSKTEKDKIKRRLQLGESVVLLDRFEVRIDLANNRQLLTIPCLDERNATITHEVLDTNESMLEGGQWGAGRLSLRDEGKKKIIELSEFHPMQSGKVNLTHLIKAREQFTTREWIYLLLRTMGYEPFAYTEKQQNHLLLRLLPMIQNNLNMMELAPKGTGKSFIFSNLSRHVWLNSGGALSNAQLFKNLTTKEIGLLGKHDVLVLDEGQSISFKGADDIHAKFKDYLESGHYSIGNDKITSECGLMILANIDLYEDGEPRRVDYIRHLPEMFHDSALIDRFHGIIAGWEIPRFSTDSAADGLGIKADVFGEYLHQLRTVSHTEFPFGDVPELHLKDMRDSNAVTRLATALSKLLLLNPEHPDYEAYVLNPAKDLRTRVRTQLAELDPHEFEAGLKVS